MKKLDFLYLKYHDISKKPFYKYQVPNPASYVRKSHVQIEAVFT